MAWSFGDSFDLYAAWADMFTGYWDTGVGVGTLVTGRFSGSRAVQTAASASVYLAKSSGVNDAVHHLVVSFQQTSAVTGSTLAGYLQLLDGTTGQCCIVFRGDGAILLTSGTPGGTVLATYTGAFPAVSTWYAFEFEVVINNTTGSFAVRKNGNSVNDFTATGLNTRPTSTNNYANKLQLGVNTAYTQQFDDLFWRSDASSVAWLGDIRCYARMPASDASVTFSRSPTNYVQTPFAFSVASITSATAARYSPFIPAFDGTISAGTVLINTAFTGNLKCSVFNGTATTITTVLASATTLVNPVSGSNALVFSSPFAVTKGTQYWIGFEADGTYSNGYSFGAGASGLTSVTTYAAFPVANNPVTTGQGPIVYSLTIPVGSNCSLVAEAQQNALTDYVYDSTPGDADFYGVASIASTPATVIATTVRAYAQKSDAGTRTMAVQLKSGATTVASPTLVLTTSGWLWAWRTDTTDPNTSLPWTAAAVNNCTIGPKVIA